jgi:hypothetical protein
VYYFTSYAPYIYIVVPIQQGTHITDLLIYYFWGTIMCHIFGLPGCTNKKLNSKKLNSKKLNKEKLDKEKERKREGKKGGNYKKTLISLIKKGKQLLQRCLYILLRPLRSAHKQLSFNFANKGKQPLSLRLVKHCPR